MTTNYVVDALDGDDTITIEETANNVEIQAGKGDDLVVTAGDISDSDKIKGGGGSDTFDFQGHISNTSIYGGKAGDSIVVTRAVSSSQIMFWQ